MSTLPPLVVVPLVTATAESELGPSGSVKFATRLPATENPSGRVGAALNSSCTLPTVSKVSFGNGGSVRICGGVLRIVRVKFCVAAGATPLSAVITSG
jgi:hypothetical protein